MSFRFIPLGTNGFFPSFGRQTMSVLLLADDEAVLLDAGTGVGRFAEPPVKELLRPYTHLTVILTHYHQDHLIGLTYLAGVWPTGTVTIFAPGPPLVETDPHAALARLVGPPLFPYTLHEFKAATTVRTYSGAPLQFDGHEITFRKQRHPGGSTGIRVGDRLAYLTDTGVQDDTATFVDGVQVLLHEVWTLADNPAPRTGALYGHSSATAVAGVAAQARIGTLMPTHFHPSRTSVEIDRMARDLERVSGVPTRVPEEGHVYDL